MKLVQVRIVQKSFHHSLLNLIFMSHSVIEKFSTLSREQRQEVIDFIEFISTKSPKSPKKERLSKKQNLSNAQEMEARYTSFTIW